MLNMDVNLRKKIFKVIKDVEYECKSDKKN